MSEHGKSFEDITARLDEIVGAVRVRDVSLERSLDLLDEAIDLGAQAVDMIDTFDVSETQDLLGALAPDEHSAEHVADLIAAESVEQTPTPSSAAGDISSEEAGIAVGDD